MSTNSRPVTPLDHQTIRPSGTVVIGLGNPLMADDGVGLKVLDRLQGFEFDPPVELVDGGTWGLNLLPAIEDAERVLFIDAINTGTTPGTLVVLERDELPRYLSTKVSPHQVDLQDVLALAELRGKLPQMTVAMGVQPARVEMIAQLSPVVERGVDLLVAAVLSRLDQWGHSGRPRRRHSQYA
jgi:hydrogenase maturation protease